MILKALEMHGFKSFPDKTVLEFGKGLTAVVGPNGSGKSNISDAIRWVLGEQSTKNLRGSKMEDVVFNGTALRRAQGYAEVTLKLDNTDRSLSMDEDEVNVTRRYYRSGDGEYRINGNTVRLKDIHELFMDTGLGRDGYSLVSQGKIADMISSKSNERREMFEEAAGISHYRYRRTDATRRLDQAQENLLRLHDILSELEGRVEPLRQQSEQAQKFLVLAEEKKELEIGLWLHTIEKSKDSLREQEHKISVASAQYEAAERELSEIEDKMSELDEKKQEITLKMDEVRHGAAKLEEQALQLESQAAVDENSILHNKEAIGRIEREKEEAARSGSEIDNDIKASLDAIEQIKLQVAQHQKQLDDVNASISHLQQEGELHAKNAADISQEMTAVAEKLGDSRVKFSTAVSSMEEISVRVATIEESLLSRNDLLERLKTEQENKRAQLKDKNEKAEELKNMVSGYSLRLESRRQKAEKQRAALEEMSLEVKQKQSRIRLLEDLEKNMEGYSGSVKAVMREAKRGNLRGIHGPVSQIINVPQEYAVAIETALGASIQNIVVENENDAKRAIYFLKDNKAGRATFLPLTAIKGRELNENGLENCFGFVSIASELVTCDSKYSEIIRSLLGRTAVAEDMDSAVQIAKKYNYRFRIVTLDGQVINAGGSMTGGSRTQNAGILSRANEMDALKSDAAKKEKEYSESLTAYKTLTEELNLAQAEFDGATADLMRVQEEIIRCESELRLAEGQWTTANTAVDELRKEKEEAAFRLESLRAERDAAEKRMRELNAQMDSFEEKLAEVTKKREFTAEQREFLNQRAAAINIDVMSAHKDVQTKNETIEQLRRRKENQLSRIELLDKEIEEINEKNSSLRAAIDGLRESAASLRTDSGSSQEKITELAKQRNDFEAFSTRLRQEEREKTVQREKISGELARLEERKTSMMKEYDDTINKLYEEYQLTRREAEQTGIRIEEPAKAQRKLSDIRGKIRALGSVNVSAIEEYKEVFERYNFMKAQIDDVEKSRDELLKLIDELTRNMSEQFREQFGKINKHFGETFVELFGGGKAELVLQDEKNVLECGIDIKIQPPGKNVQNIDLFSGGEKGLSAIALLFAILKVTPSPFCVFDEVEAALDDVNVTRYAQYCRRMTDNTQFILITHRRGTMEEADVLYGITMQEKGVSKLLELKTAETAKRLGIA